MRYLPHTPEDVRTMLDAIGVDDVDALFEPIPPALRLDRPLDLPPALDEAALREQASRLAERNAVVPVQRNFAGAGVYTHVRPAAVEAIVQRGEFFTAYTPYQPEVSQGVLQATFEFQTMVCELLGTEVANASLYDGATAAAEATLMARRVTRRDRVVVAPGVHPDTAAVIEQYNRGNGGQVVSVPGVSASAGLTDLPVDEQTAALVVQTPGFYGVIEDIEAAAAAAHAAGALLVAIVGEATALGVLEPPGYLGADIVVAEGQPLGLPPSFGGPHCGLFGTRRRLVRQMPGRVVGQAVDADGHRAFVLTLTAREQHIRRHRATSNICTNQGLMALAIAVWLALMGPRGLERIGRNCLAACERLRRRIEAAPHLQLVDPNAPTYNELAVRLPGARAAAVVERMLASSPQWLAGVAAARWSGHPDDVLLVATNERHRPADIDAFVDALDRAAAEEASKR